MKVINDYGDEVVKVYAVNGELIGEFFLEKRYLVPLDKIPLLVRQAFVAAEDSTPSGSWTAMPSIW